LTEIIGKRIVSEMVSSCIVTLFGGLENCQMIKKKETETNTNDTKDDIRESSKEVIKFDFKNAVIKIAKTFKHLF